MILAFVFFAAALLGLANRRKFRDGTYQYYQDIYEPTGPWWRNGAWRPSRVVTGLLVDLSIVGFIVAGSVVMLSLG